MGAETRLAVVLFGSFVLWIPALNSVLRGELDAGAAGIRWGIGAVLVWTMVAVLSQLIGSYAVATVEDGPARRASDDEPGARRRSDRPESGPEADRATDEVDHADAADGDVTAQDHDAAAMETV